MRDAVVIQALRDAQARARASISDPKMAQIQVHKLQVTIDELGALHAKCVKSIP